MFHLPIFSKPLNYLVILLDSSDGFQRGLEQNPTEDKYPYRESNLPCPRRLRTPPNQGQRQGPHTTDCDDNKGFSEIPFNLFLCKALGVGTVDKLTAVFTLYRVVLNFFSAERTLFHYHLSWWNDPELSQNRPNLTHARNDDVPVSCHGQKLKGQRPTLQAEP